MSEGTDHGCHRLRRQPPRRVLPEPGQCRGRRHLPVAQPEAEHRPHQGPGARRDGHPRRHLLPPDPGGGGAGLDLPPRGAVLRSHLVGGPGVDGEHERRGPGQPLRGPAGARPPRHALPRLRIQRGVRLCGAGGDADHRGQSPAAAVALRRQQGRPGPARLPVLPLLRSARHPHEGVQPRRAAPG